jgi:hypothetical protein
MPMLMPGSVDAVSVPEKFKSIGEAEAIAAMRLKIAAFKTEEDSQALIMIEALA